jgi:hypothetical protein
MARRPIGHASNGGMPIADRLRMSDVPHSRRRLRLSPGRRSRSSGLRRSSMPIVRTELNADRADGAQCRSSARSSMPISRCRSLSDDLSADDLQLASDGLGRGLGQTSNRTWPSGQPSEFGSGMEWGGDDCRLSVWPHAMARHHPPATSTGRLARPPPRAHTSSGGRKYLGAKNPYTRIDLIISTRQP